MNSTQVTWIPLDPRKDAVCLISGVTRCPTTTYVLIFVECDCLVLFASEVLPVAVARLSDSYARTPQASGRDGNRDRRPHRSPINSYNGTHGIGRISGTPPSDGEMMTLFSPIAAALSAWRPSYAR